MRIGVIQPLPGIGDMVWFVPALKAIAAMAPQGKIILFTRSSSQARAVLRNESILAHVIDLPKKRRGALAAIPNFIATWWALVRVRPDRLYILHHSFRYRLAARLAGIHDIVTYPPELAHTKQDSWNKSLTFLKKHDVIVTQPHATLSVAESTRMAIRQYFGQHPQPWLIVAPGASTKERCWSVENFAALTSILTRAVQGTIFIMGCGSEAERVAEIHRLCPPSPAIVPVTHLNFDQAMGLMANSIALVGNDSGPANVAAALGCPAFPLCGTSAPPLHSPNLHMIMPDLSPELGSGMQRISVAAAAQEVLDTLHNTGILPYSPHTVMKTSTNGR